MNEIIFSRKAEKQLVSLDKTIRQKVFGVLDALEKEFFPKGYDIKKLTGSKEDFRIRLGTYRVIFRVRKKRSAYILQRLSKERLHTNKKIYSKCLVELELTIYVQKKEGRRGKAFTLS